VTPDDVSRALFQNAPAGLFAMSADGVISAANDTFCAWTGYTTDALIGRHFRSLLSAGSTLLYETRFTPMLQNQQSVNEMKLTLQTRTGDTRDVLVSSELRGDGADGLVYAAVFDAGIRLKYERELLAARRTAEAAVARVQILQQAAAGLATATTIASFGSALRSAAERATDATHVSVIVMGADGALDLVSGSRPLDDAVALVALLPVIDCVQTGQPVLCRTPDEITAAYPDQADELDAGGVEAFCLVPVIDDGAVSGAVACWFQRRRDDLDDGLLALLAALATQAAPVLQRIHLQDLVQHQSLHDSLTGLPNRLALLNRLTPLLDEPERPDRPLAVLFLDLDGFKAINDRFGHEAGDQVLQQVAERLPRSLRVGDIASRFGGDEFVLVCDGVDEDTALDVARRIRQAVEEPLLGLAAGSTVSASIGISVVRPGAFLPVGVDRLTPSALIAVADEAMLTSKRAGKRRDTLVTV